MTNNLNLPDSRGSETIVERTTENDSFELSRSGNSVQDSNSSCFGQGKTVTRDTKDLSKRLGDERDSSSSGVDQKLVRDIKGVQSSYVTQKNVAEETMSTSQNGYFKERKQTIATVQKRRSVQRENHNAHTQRCREKINQMFSRLNEALPLRADGTKPRKKAEILARALEVVRELQFENISLKRTVEDMVRASRTPYAYYPFPSSAIGISSQQEFVTVQNIPTEYYNATSGIVPMRSNVTSPGIQQISQQYGLFPQQSIPGCIHNLSSPGTDYSRSYQETANISPGSSNLIPPKLPPIIPSQNIVSNGMPRVDNVFGSGTLEMKAVIEDSTKSTGLSVMGKCDYDSYISGLSNSTLISNSSLSILQNRFPSSSGFGNEAVREASLSSGYKPFDEHAVLKPTKDI